MEKGKGMPQIARGHAVRKSADPVAVAIAVLLIAYGIATACKVARLKICLYEKTQIFGQTQPFFGRGNFGCLMNFRIDSCFYVHCDSCS